MGLDAWHGEPPIYRSLYCFRRGKAVLAVWPWKTASPELKQPPTWLGETPLLPLATPYLRLFTTLYSFLGQYNYEDSPEIA